MPAMREMVIPCLTYDNVPVSFLKHGSGQDKDIVLVPQPTDSPRDPLNWPLWRRDLIFLIFATNSGVLSAWGEMLAPGYGVLAEQFNIVCSMGRKHLH